MRTGQTSKEGAMSFQLTREGLTRTKKKALRQRCWFKVLNRMERSILDLTIRCVERVRSPLLKRSLMPILSKLFYAMEKGYTYVIERIGRPLAAKVSSIAESWGNKDARTWKNDQALIRYLGATGISLRRFPFGGRPH